MGEQSEGSWVGVAIPLGIATLCFLGALIYLLTGEASRGWPSAPGEVLSAGIEERVRRDPARPHFEQTDFVPKVTYRYTVRGEAHQSGQLALFVTGYETRAAARERIAPYTVGASVPVHYDPENPGLAVLETDWEPGILLGMLGFGLLGSFFGLSELATLRRERGERKERGKRKQRRPGKKREKRRR